MPFQVERHAEDRGVQGEGCRLARKGSRRQHLGFSVRLLPLHCRHVGEKAEDRVTDLMCLLREEGTVRRMTVQV